MHVVSTVQTQIPVLQGSSYFSATLSHLLILLRNAPNSALSRYLASIGPKSLYLATPHVFYSSGTGVPLGRSP